MAKCDRCDKPAVAKGLCSTHYRGAKVRLRETALKDIVDKVDQMIARRPDLAPILNDMIKDARPLFRPPTKADEMATMRAELNELRAMLKSSTKFTKGKT